MVHTHGTKRKVSFQVHDHTGTASKEKDKHHAEEVSDSIQVDIYNKEDVTKIKD